MRIFFFIFILLFSTICSTNPNFNFPLILFFLITSVSLFYIKDFWRVLAQPQKLIFIYFLGLITLYGFRMSPVFLERSSISRSCLKLPGFWTKLECLSQLNFEVSSGFMQLTLHITALCVFMLAYSTKEVFLNSVFSIILMIFFLGLQLYCLACPTFFKESLWSSNFIYSENWSFMKHRGMGLFANPSWLWPFCLTPLTMSLYFIQKRRALLLNYLSIIVILLNLIRSEQRGAIILSALTLFFIFILNIDSLHKLFPLKSLKLFYSLLGILTIILSVSFVLVFYPQKDLLSQERFQIWSIAIPPLWEKLLWGHGVFSWKQFFSLYATSSPELVFDTAHNLWLQILFELGLIHGLLILLGMFLYLKSFFHFNKVSIFFLISVFFCTCIQEIDYIPSIYLFFAAGLGWISSRYQEC